MILVTGVAGFIGFHITRKLLDLGYEVIGVDNLNEYYEVLLKTSRLHHFDNNEKFKFIKADISDYTTVENIIKKYTNINYIIHLAAQAGVRYSIINPQTYLKSNIVGHHNILSACLNLKNLYHVIYASSSSVYGNNSIPPFSVDAVTDFPVSFYAATKKSCEIMSHSYSQIYNIPLTGLRFFTVYGEWGRPDMAYFSFTKKIINREPIQVYNYGNMSRDFTHISDIVDGVVKLLNNPPKKTPPHSIYNLGNSISEKITDLIQVIGSSLKIDPEIEYLPMQPGDVENTCADITLSRSDFGFKPYITIYEGVPDFVDWYCNYYNINLQK